MRKNSIHITSLSIPIFFALALSASQANAQVLIQASQSITYTELTAPTIITTTGDSSTFVVTAPFPVQYYNNTYNDLLVSTNGPIRFPGVSTFISDTNQTPGSSFLDNWIAGAWDDFELVSTNAHIAHQTQGTAPNRTWTIQFRDIQKWNQPGSYVRWQVRFFEGQQRYEVDYGSATGTPTLNASFGMEDSTGGNAFFFSANNCTTLCSLTDYNALANTRVTVFAPPEPELSGDVPATFPRGALPGGQVSGDVTLINQGTNPATNVVSHLYLSLDDTLDQGDILVASATTASVPNGSTTVTMDVTVPAATAPGDYTLILDVDATDAWVEVIEGDNEVEGPMFATAHEFAPTAISTAQSGINPGETANFDVTIAQDGVPYSGPVEVTVYASTDTVFDAMDVPILAQNVTLTGAASETVPASGTLPSLQPGAYYAVVVVDSNMAVDETVEANNTIVSAATFQSGPDFGVASVGIPASVQPGAAAQIITTISSLSVPFSGAVSYRLYASLDQMIDGMDASLGIYTATFAGEASLPDTQSVTFPAALPPGAYYIIAQVDHTNAIIEVDEMNNVTVSVTTLANAPDFAISGAAFTPNTVEVGDMVNVTATLNSNGLPFTGNVNTAVVLSNDPMFDPGDTTIFSDTVFVGGVTTANVDFNFALPVVVPGGYTLFVVADANNQQAEADEMNNAGGANGLLSIQGADLRVETITGEPVAFIGRPYRVELTVSNTGVADARGFQYAYYLSEDEAIRIFDQQIFVSTTATIASGDQMSFTDTVTIPSTFTATQTLNFGVIVDVFDAVPETNVPNNINRIRPPIRVVFPIPDLEAQIVETPTAAAAGEQIAVTRQILNSGTADAMSFEYRYYISTNPMITIDDQEIGSFNASLAEGADDYAIDVMTLPSDVADGSYYIGLIVDPDDVVDEVDEDNNAAVGPQVPIFEAAIQFITDRLPDATAGVPYETGVFAQGGPLAITWSVQSGALPDGIAIDANSGIVSGTPTVEGLFNFVLRASSGTAYAEQPFSIRVSSPTVELEIATASLPSGIAGRDYSTQLIAVGGIEPYEWEAISALPDGLTLSKAGLLSGAPVQPGNLPVTVSVRDAVNNSDSKALVLPILNANQAVQITQVPLPSAIVGLPFCDPEVVSFEAENGVPPYSWSAIGGLPAGMTINADGELCGVPEEVGEFPITVRAQDATGLFDTALFILEVNGGNELAISTFSLPDGQVGEAYTQTLTAVRGAEPYTWSLVEGAGALPDGVTLEANGTLSGTASGDGVFAFVVQVTDSALRVDTQPLSVSINPAPEGPGDDDGCGCTAADEQETEAPMASLLAMLMIGAVLLRRRR